ncbi:hypothetical protein [Macrococcus equipercicus]|uniref:Uncharacterized protein n=1 Tax=Macrococcus equipercicus TaxID=69967 RepID=A0A9Q9F186_9STAP|nr:hypothetical protein [Macrococcus equipercicus]UTH13121.1 hypothetical protein KFV11_07540 [Macrococcus equipercicus]
MEQVQAGSNMIDGNNLITIHYWDSLSAVDQSRLIGLNDEQINSYTSINEHFEKWNGVWIVYT